MQEPVIVIQRVIEQSLVLMRTNALLLLKYGLPAIALGVVLRLSEVSEGAAHYALAQLLWIAYGLSLVLAMVSAHRLFLLPPEDNADLRPLRWSMRETRFLGWWVVIGIAVTVLGVVWSLLLMPALMPWLSVLSQHNLVLAVQILIGLPLSYLVARWSLVLPAAAIGGTGKTLVWSWQLSKGNGWNIFLLLGALPVLLEIVFRLLPVTGAVWGVLYLFAWLVVALFEVCLLSVCYSVLREGDVEH